MLLCRTAEALSQLPACGQLERLALGNERRVILENELFYICVEDNEWSLAVELVQKDSYSDCESAWMAGLQKRRYREYLDSMKKALLARLPSIGIRTGAWTSGTITREEAGVC